MARSDSTLSGVERTFGRDEIIVSKTDLKGRIIYANEVFLRLAGYSEAEVIGKPHSLIRHPHMPRAVFKLLWDTIQSGRECFAYVVNRSKNGDHYWVLAHVTPTFDSKGEIVSYHSNRRVPKRESVTKVEALYGELLEIENKNPDRKQGMEAAYQALNDKLQALGVPYDEFVFAL
ncbi:PAS domain-containing protein [Magnetospirillum sp. 64-120]|uniref:PAS domain-containing protein n=1 Tax=Magnetospirillum sp. 64-120 TaxID=1895778 RepID=UPI0009293BDE|nr:PAS domain-containing protein [Magnetospirillum sp. 64-120]OJX68088.1 MAG: chemotaxis protein [Magnetospirillum sp. 64-120]